ncbi:TPA: hypothetical protein ACOEQV_000050 [Stenotrophomonas maltophilia]
MSKQQRWARMAGQMVLALAALGSLVACGGPADKKLATGGTPEEYRASINQIEKNLSAHERDAFNWAVAGFDLAKLHAAYPNASPRQVIRGQISNVKATYPAQIQDLRSLAQAQEPTRAELAKVRAVARELRIDNSFFGPKPKIDALIVNGSNLSLSQITWLANLYLDGSAKPVARAKLASDFRDLGGLKPGDKISATFAVGFVRGDETWTTLEVRNARSKRVELEPIAETGRDFGDKPYITADYQSKIEVLEKGLRQAESFTDI